MGTNTPLCNFAQSKALKELGFNETTQFYFDGSNTVLCDSLQNKNRSFSRETSFSIPTQDQALRFFRNVKGVHGWVESEYLFDEWKYRWSYRSLGDLYSLPIPVLDHDEAQSALVSRIIEILNETKG